MERGYPPKFVEANKPLLYRSPGQQRTPSSCRATGRWFGFHQAREKM